MEESSSLHGPLSGDGRKKSHVYSVFPEKPAAVSSVEDLFGFICAGPLIEKTGLAPEKVAESIDKWLLCGSQLCRLFQLNELYLNDAQKVRIYHYYIPVFLWCEDQISQHASMFKDGQEVPPLVVQLAIFISISLFLYSLQFLQMLLVTLPYVSHLSSKLA